MREFWSGYVLGRAIFNRRFIVGAGTCVLVAMAVSTALRLAHAVTTRTATDDRPPSAHLRHPAMATREVLEALSPFGDCQLTLAVAIPPPAEARPVIDATQVQRRAVMAGKVVRQYDTDADPYRRVEVRIDHRADDVALAGVIRAAFTPTETMTTQLKHGRPVYHQVHGWKCQKTEFRADGGR